MATRKLGSFLEGFSDYYTKYAHPRDENARKEEAAAKKLLLDEQDLLAKQQSNARTAEDYLLGKAKRDFDARKAADEAKFYDANFPTLQAQKEFDRRNTQATIDRGTANFTDAQAVIDTKAKQDIAQATFSLEQSKRELELRQQFPTADANITKLLATQLALGRPADEIKAQYPQLTALIDAMPPAQLITTLQSPAASVISRQAAADKLAAATLAGVTKQEGAIATKEADTAGKIAVEGAKTAGKLAVKTQTTVPTAGVGNQLSKIPNGNTVPQTVAVQPVVPVAAAPATAPVTPQAAPQAMSQVQAQVDTDMVAVLREIKQLEALRPTGSQRNSAPIAAWNASDNKKRLDELYRQQSRLALSRGY